MKHMLWYCIFPALLINSSQGAVRCNQCAQKKDEMPALMAQTFFNILINGFIATQSSTTKEQQNAAVVNALNCLSQFVQNFAKKNYALTRNDKAQEHAVLELFEEYLKDAAFIEQFAKELSHHSNRLKLVAILEQQDDIQQVVKAV